MIVRSIVVICLLIVNNVSGKNNSNIKKMKMIHEIISIRKDSKKIIKNYYTMINNITSEFIAKNGELIPDSTHKHLLIIANGFKDELVKNERLVIGYLAKMYDSTFTEKEIKKIFKFYESQEYAKMYHFDKEVDEEFYANPQSIISNLYRDYLKRLFPYLLESKILEMLTKDEI